VDTAEQIYLLLSLVESEHARGRYFWGVRPRPKRYVASAELRGWTEPSM
jgi:hypothetical protein